MGAAYFITVKDEIPNFNPENEFDGSALANTSMVFDDLKLYEKLSITPLEEFIGGAGLDFDDFDLGDVADSWFDPDQGLKTVAGMQAYIVDHKDSFDGWEMSLNELESVSTILLICKKHETQWCLGIDV